MSVNNKRKIIIVTDGDRCAQRAIEIAVERIGGRCISKSGGNPTPLSGGEIVKLVKEAKNDPVVVMTDDEGNENIGIGEKVLQKLLTHPDIEVLGIIAVASNTQEVEGVHVDFSIDKNGKITDNAVDKDGKPTSQKVLYGDTVDIIEKCPKPPIIIGIGDIGKMNGKDDSRKGAPIFTRALEEIITRSGITIEH
ncbi:stage V sporulation protein AE [Alkaliphilus peptidifermentans]|uniref:Stage V sporulation protein AE n=1 Tax=Alkaliphilus peptidifermentans DSM 18978 TaxID=1120976 RepID=A0A1G5JV13_9FIRM|nr:stage V sporulation protein AE [Alkaliphilus peptidifermentans]SCY92157.1 stage V sporulation protein AE [Alkaliphilus peptidifermentans DSM 18978]